MSGRFRRKIEEGQHLHHVRDDRAEDCHVQERGSDESRPAVEVQDQRNREADNRAGDQARCAAWRASSG